MDKLSTLLPKVLNKRGLRNEANAALVVYHANLWIEDHMPEFQPVLRAVSYTDKKLVMDTDNSIAAQELRSHQPILIEYLSTMESMSPVDEIDIRRST